MGEIYKAENNINHKVYIGKSILTMEDRRRDHLYRARTDQGTYLHKAIKKYGAENFTWTVIEECSNKEQLAELEKKYIAEYKSNNPEFGYNLTTGGDGGSGPKSIETRKKISESKKGTLAWNKGLDKTDERVAKYSESLKGNKNCEGRVMSEGNKQKLIASRKGHKASEETLEKLRAIKGDKHWNYGGHITKEQKQAISIAQKNRKRTPEELEKLRQAGIGRIPWNKGIKTGKPSLNAKKIMCIETGIIYDSMTDVFNKTGINRVSRVCSGQMKTAGGFHWAYYLD
jgi:group I intron endonuclease